ncbi:uncharacterized protein [Macrobrachium rosenbergii]|uniref:uncharacterized protein n=1 Tax=Macrobrachium rosenbergii TaxID=79674 RepID=UPI0034D6634C
MMAAMAAIHRYRTALLTCALFFMVSYNAFLYFFTAYPFNVPRNYMADPIPTRRALAREIMEVQREIEVRTEFSKEVDRSWGKRLLVVASELDPRVATSQREVKVLVSPALSRPTGSASDLGQLRRVCPERYRGRAFDEDMKGNWETVPCQSEKFRDVLTIVLPAKGWTAQRIQKVINIVRKYSDVDIVVLTHGHMEESLEGASVVVKRFGLHTTESKALNSIISTVRTPYLFVGHSLVSFDEETNLERLVRVLEDNPEVGVASGAYKDTKGIWRHGCLQGTAENYELEYVRGYEHSHNECMYCDDVLGPFVVRTEFLKAVFLTETMEGPVMYRDWFLNVHLARKLVMTCPDVMFYVDSEPTLSRNDWFKIAQKWSIEHILPPEGEGIRFSCDEAQISCNNLMKSVSSFLVPPCCREIFRKELQYVQDCADEIGLHYELNAGSLLGAVKMDGMLPWDFDSDIIPDCGDKSVWMSKGRECLAKKGCTLKTVLGSYWTSTCNVSTVDLNCYENRTKKLTADYSKVPTVILFNGIATRVPLNPGRTVRNYFGEEYLKHAVHWRYSSNAIFPVDDGSGQTPGLWSNCIVPSFHSCIDHFPVDGNIKFHKSRCKKP